jgi:hypothetical protein
MKIRSITAFVGISYPLDSGVLAGAGTALQAARAALSEAGFEVQTTRLAAQPFPVVLAEQGGPLKAIDLAKDLEALAFVHEIDYVSLGPARLDDPAAYIEAIPEVLAQTEKVFAAIEIASRKGGVSLSRIRRAANVVSRVSALNGDGFTNLRLAALANVPAWSPFFPAAYHQGGALRVAVATESADLAIASVSASTSLKEARAALTHAIEGEAGRIENALRPALAAAGAAFQGIDFSLAPFPDETCSIGAAFERLGLPAVGMQGSLLAAALLTDAIDRASFTRTGFCGLMLPVLEDSTLALRAAEGHLSITDLLTYSAVCGTGLDTVPLPGDVDNLALSAILADVAALALRLDKPLTARLMPLPGKQAGDEVSFDFEYFAPGRVMAPASGSLSGLLIGEEEIEIGALRSRQG